MEVGRRNDREEKRGQKGCPSSYACPGEPRDQVANETGGDHHRAWGDERDRDRVEKLSLRQPVMPKHHPAVQERHDCKAAAEDEAPRIGEESEDLEQEDGAAGLGQGTTPPEDRRRRAHHPHQRAPGKDEHNGLASRDRRSDGDGQEHRPEE